MHWTFETSSEPIRIELNGADDLEALRAALDDPVWLLGATWEALYTNDFKRGRFQDALGAWLERRDGAQIASTLQAAGVNASTDPT
jgi:hypothetical protein